MYIHLGMHKTGTTSLQYFLSNNKDWLGANNILYPSSGQGPGDYYQHLSGCAAFMTAEERRGSTIGTPEFDMLDSARIVAELLDEIRASNCDRIVLSCEIFSLMPHTSINRLERALAEFDIIPIIFIRNFPDYIDALFQTLSICYRASYSVEQCVSFYQNAFNLAANAEAWAKIAVDKHIRVINFDAIRGQGSLRVFMQTIGTPVDDIVGRSEAGHLNVSLPAYKVAIARALRAQNLDEAEIERTLWQFTDFRTGEQQTSLPADLRRELKRKYLEELARLQASSSVVGLETNGQSDAVLKAIDDKVLVDDLAGAVMAIGRGLAFQKSLAQTGPESNAGPEERRWSKRRLLSAIPRCLQSLRQGF